MTEDADSRREGDPDAEATLQLMIAIGRAYRALERGVRPSLAEHGLGLSEFAVLEILLHKGPLSLGAIGSRILVSGASITYVVTKLEDRGLVRRTPSPSDQRVIIAELTEAGRALIRGVFPEHVQTLCRLMADLTEAEKRGAARVLRRLAAQTAPRTSSLAPGT